MNITTKVLVVRGESHSGKTTVLQMLSQHLQEFGYTLLSRYEHGNPEGDIYDLLRSKSKKLVFISTMGDYRNMCVSHFRLTQYHIFNLLVCACNNDWINVMQEKIPNAIYFEKEKDKYKDDDDVQKIAQMIEALLK